MCVADLNSVEEDLGVTMRYSLHSALYSRSHNKSIRYLQYKVFSIIIIL